MHYLNPVSLGYKHYSRNHLHWLPHSVYLEPTDLVPTPDPSLSDDVVPFYLLGYPSVAIDGMNI